MKIIRTCFTINLLFLCLALCHAQSNICANGDLLVVNNTGSKNNQCIAPGAQPAGTGTTMTVTNDTVTGTTLNKFAKLTGAPSKAIVSSNGDTENAIGVVTSGAGTSGNATITILGQVSCIFDGATTAGNYVTIAATGGGCHDAGSTYPTSGATYGRVLSTNGGAGTYVMELMTPDIAFQNAGNGKSKPGGSTNQPQYNSSNQFDGMAGQTWNNTNKTLAWAQGTLTTSSPFIDHSATWNAAQVFTGFKSNTTVTSASLNSRLLDIQAGGTTQAAVQLVSGTTQFALAVQDGSNARPAFSFLNDLSTGMNRGVSGIEFDVSGAVQFRVNDTNVHILGANGIEQRNGGPYRWQSSTQLLDLGGGGLRIEGNSGGQGTTIVLGDNSSATQGTRIKRTGNYFEFRTGSDSAYTYTVDAGNEFTSAQFDKTNATLADVTGLTSETLTAGKTYVFNAELFVDADVTGGSKYAIAGTATATAIKYHIDMICDATNLLVITSRQTALAGSAGQAGCTAGLTKISGTITVNAAGTLAVQFAQNTANGTSSVLTMSKFEVRQLN